MRTAWRNTCAPPRSRPWLPGSGRTVTHPVATRRCAGLSEISWKHAVRARSWCALARTQTTS
ncbi:hypothetical protein Esi_0374_0020 [Ectocarpus siliculosus]|uniref:Uncharacterized protein n=1 Tax=Ectocarpus siliculosus TaxID=2880 RepID=D7FZI5_ECTSI|nr:hypothetical protein Esi_0374_0020 [Ectocarpus siliculosus]|eukprot:CBJ32792.1 hypothetical protein Esi_0374_0020 [Ectocarpus siliculosus]